MIERIKKVMEYKDLTPAVFADQLEISRSNLTHLFSGRNQPSLALIKKILETYPEISTEWLMMGVGNMFNQELHKTSISNVNIEAQKTPSSNEYDLFSGIDEPVENVFSEATPSVVRTDSLDNDIAEENTETTVSAIQQTVASQVSPITEPPIDVPRRRVTQKRAANPDSTRLRSQISDSRDVKKVKKIVFFYADNTFEEFFPE